MGSVISNSLCPGCVRHNKSFGAHFPMHRTQNITLSAMKNQTNVVNPELELFSVG